MEANLLAEHGGEDVHTKPLSHGLTQDGEAAVGDGGAQQAAHSDDDKQQRHELQVGTHLLLVRLVESLHGPHQGHGAQGHRRAVHQGTQNSGDEEGPLRLVVAQQPAHGHLVLLVDLLGPLLLLFLLPGLTLRLGFRAVPRELACQHHGGVLRGHNLCLLSLLGALLRGHEGVVGALLLHQRSVVPLLHEAAAVQHVDEISVTNRTEAVRNAHNAHAVVRL
mmetsp:Transcript_57937/g.137996  ORF Transcript_57937/g.137996 Transcript_57937/m.137996 type:complete len:221 (-) Transcript_57937:1839-2501(-)